MALKLAKQNAKKIMLLLCLCVLSGELGVWQNENLQKSRNIFSKQPLPKLIISGFEVLNGFTAKM